MGWRRRRKGQHVAPTVAFIVSPDLASLLFPSFTVCVGRVLCAPELSLADLGSDLVGAIEVLTFQLVPEPQSNVESLH